MATVVGRPSDAALMGVAPEVVKLPAWPSTCVALGGLESSGRPKPSSRLYWKSATKTPPPSGSPATLPHGNFNVLALAADKPPWVKVGWPMRATAAWFVASWMARRQTTVTPLCAPLTRPPLGVT